MKKKIIIIVTLFLALLIIVGGVKSFFLQQNNKSVKVSKQVEEYKNITFKDMLEHKEYRTPQDEALVFWAKRVGEYDYYYKDKAYKLKISKYVKYCEDYKIEGVECYDLFAIYTLKIDGNTAYCFYPRLPRADGNVIYRFYKFDFENDTVKVWGGDYSDFSHMELLFTAIKEYKPFGIKSILETIDLVHQYLKYLHLLPL